MLKHSLLQMAMCEGMNAVTRLRLSQHVVKLNQHVFIALVSLSSSRPWTLKHKLFLEPKVLSAKIKGAKVDN
jgi:hypothetical protein